MKNSEIEMKFKINDQEYKTIVSFLEDTAIYIQEIHQKDIYYSPYNENFYDNGYRCLRLRLVNSEAILCYKEIHNIFSAEEYIDEYETKVENADTMAEILRVLNFKEDIVVDKQRREYRYKDKFLISMDYVKYLGYFIEVENIDTNLSLKQRIYDLKQFVQSINLNLDNRNTEGYSNMLYKQKGELNT